MAKCIDHLGNEYSSLTKMFNAWGTNYTTFKYRTEKIGMSLKDALETPVDANTGGNHAIKDHLGNKFPSKEAMCTHYGIPRATFFRRLRIGWDLETALTKPLKHNAEPNQKLIDPNGNEFSSMEELCAAWNIPKKDYVTNIKRGLSIKDALTHVPEKIKHGSNACQDHLGNTYSSFNDMCKHYGISKDTLRGRIDLGWTLQEILDAPKKKSPAKTCKDHLGNEYARQKDMLDKYKVHQTLFRYRQKLGWTLEECLTGRDYSRRRKNIKDYTGDKYPSEAILCALYNINTATFYARIEKKNIKDVLFKFSKSKYDKFGPNIRIIKELNDYFYEVLIDDETCIMSATDIINNYREKIVWPVLGYRIIKFDDEGNARIYIDGKYKTKNYNDVAKDIYKFKHPSSPKGESNMASN